MKINFFLHSQKQTFYGIIMLYLVSLLLLLAVAVQPFVRIGELTRDPMAVVDGKFYYGMISNIGVLLWCATVAICFFSFFLLKIKKVNRRGYFLLAAGTFTLFLLVDDLFMVHEQILPHFLQLSEKYLIVLYPIFSFWLLLRFRKEILRTPYLILLSALGFLATSVLVDALPNQGERDIDFLYEDGPKFLGIVGWSYYFITACYHTLKDTLFLEEADKNLSFNH